MEQNDIINLFSEENIRRYSNYFNIPKVVEQANKIEEIIKNGKDMSKDEMMASACLAAIKLKNSYGGRNE